MSDPSETVGSPAAAALPARLAERALAGLRAASPQHAALLEDGALCARVGQVAVASDFAIDTLRRQPALLEYLSHPDPAPLPLPVLDPADPNAWPGQLRRYRSAGSTRLVWRDVLGLDTVEQTLAGSTALAEQCLSIALAAVEGEFAQRHGVVRDEAGIEQRLVVFGLGKLGGGELNFSSDIDLVYAYPRDGESDGRRALEAEDYFARPISVLPSARASMPPVAWRTWRWASSACSPTIRSVRPNWRPPWTGSTRSAATCSRT